MQIAYLKSDSAVAFFFTAVILAAAMVPPYGLHTAFFVVMAVMACAAGWSIRNVGKPAPQPCPGDLPVVGQRGFAPRYETGVSPEKIESAAFGGAWRARVVDFFFGGSCLLTGLFSGRVCAAKTIPVDQAIALALTIGFWWWSMRWSLNAQANEENWSLTRRLIPIALYSVGFGVAILRQ